ncbi:DUF6745 domain-containing protein [Deinococcus arcticus]|uniref:DUF6745 domain-containing protein n=1 Tax=Deinococcus arcticus TaxID=2136176 RepID=A0A2T3WCS9_9DEIO|nr:hypothetical protein [Deinococcus arcticus]PTA69709.1 hypothetical protein C8263_01445 [Deinococcus arcticus]
MIRFQSGGRTIRRPGTEARKVAPDPADRPAPAAPVQLAPAPSGRPASQPQAPLTLSPEDARARLRRGETFAALVVTGPLNLAGSAWLRALPDWLRCTALNVDDCAHLSTLPADLHAERVSARRCPNLHEVDGRLSIREGLNLSGSGLRRIHADLHATRLNVAGCRDLSAITGAVSVVHLDVRRCAALTTLDPGLHVTQTIDVAGSGLRALPGHIRAGLRWNEVPVDARVAFTPEALNGREVMAVRNVQRRRVLLDRLGIDRFLEDVGGLVLDRDHDAGGERRLIRVPFDNDEDLVAVLVQCPSTGGRYALRVPPHLRTCREAVAWTAGLSVTDYQPTQEA